jgi:hypothetical protein
MRGSMGEKPKDSMLVNVQAYRISDGYGVGLDGMKWE